MSNSTELVAHIKSLASRRATPERIAELRQALTSKHEDVRSVAITVLGKYGSRECVEMIKSFLDTVRFQPAGWSIRGVAIKALLPNISPVDANWALNHFFLMQGEGDPTSIDWNLLDHLPKEVVSARLRLEVRSTSTARRTAAINAARRLGISLPV